MKKNQSWMEGNEEYQTDSCLFALCCLASLSLSQFLTGCACCLDPSASLSHGRGRRDDTVSLS